MLAELGEAALDDSPRGTAAFGLCVVALEHWASLRALMALELATSAVSLMRLRFEALTRAMWLIYVGHYLSIAKLLAPLSAQSEQAAKGLPNVNEMIGQLGKRVGQGVPAGAHLMLVRFKDATWNTMNSFVHSGIHPLRHANEGFPMDLALQVVRHGNGLATMTGMTLAILAGDEGIASRMSKIQPAFADCLPDLVD